MAEFSRFTLDADGESLSCFRMTADHPIGQLLLMHGAGAGNKERYTALAEALRDQKMEVVAFDFSGHGASTGQLAELSLSRRFVQAKAVLERTRRMDLPLLVMGFSMSGQTVCDLIADDHIGVDIDGAVLCCPAAYARDVHTLPFGNPEFTTGIRRKDSWRTSTNFEALRTFDKPVLVVQPELDDVIPPAIIDTMVGCRSARPTKHVLLTGAPHKIAGWLDDRPEKRKDLAAEVRGLIRAGR